MPSTNRATQCPRPPWYPKSSSLFHLSWRGCGGRRCLGRLEGGREQVAGRQAAVGPPFAGDVEDFLLGGEVVELIRGPHGLAERKVARQDDVFPAERDEHGALDGPRAYPRDSGELCDELVIGQAAQGVLVQPPVR